MRKKHRNLSLNKVTIRRLTSRQLGGIRGAGWNPNTKADCVSIQSCSSNVGSVGITCRQVL